MAQRFIPSFAVALLVAISPFTFTANALAQAGTPFGINGRLKACGTKLCNQYDQPIQLRGISTHGLQWYPWGQCLKDESLESLLKDWGADVLRVSMYIQEEEEGWETDKPKYTQMVDQVIEAATAKGLYVIIDFHQLKFGDPNANLDNAIEYFTHMAPKHGAKGNVLYEICNEPNGDNAAPGVTVNWNTIKQYADKVIPIIRNYDTKSPILVGTMGWSSLGVSEEGPWTDITASPLTDPNIFYTFHFYAASHGAEYQKVLTAASAKLPLFVSEFGTQKASGGGDNDFTSSKAWLDLLDSKKISWVNWNFSDDMLSGAVLKKGSCPNGPWTGSSLKEAGTWIQARMKTPDDFPTALTPSSRSATSPRLTMRAAGERKMNLWVDYPGAWHLEVMAADGRLLADLAGAGMRQIVLNRSSTSGIHLVRLRHAGGRIQQLSIF